jgi:hypothetical protein
MRRLLLAVRLGAILIAVPCAAHSTEQPGGAVTITGPSAEPMPLFLMPLGSKRLTSGAIPWVGGSVNHPGTMSVL